MSDTNFIRPFEICIFLDSDEKRILTSFFMKARDEGGSSTCLNHISSFFGIDRGGHHYLRITSDNYKIMDHHLSLLQQVKDKTEDEVDFWHHIRNMMIIMREQDVPKLSKYDSKLS